MSSYYYILLYKCVLVLPHAAVYICPHTIIYYYITLYLCVLMLPQATVYMCVCPHTTIFFAAFDQIVNEAAKYRYRSGNQFHCGRYLN